MSKVAPGPVGSPRLRSVAFLMLVVLAVVGVLALMYRPSADPEALAQRARDEFMARQFDLANVDLDQVFRLRTPIPVDWMLRAQLLMEKGRNEEALAALAKVPDDHLMAAQARLQAGQIELRRSRYRLAEASFLKAIQLDPKLLQARRELVFIYGMQLRRTELDAAFAELSKISTLSYSEAFHWSLIRSVSWDAAEIVETLGKCIAADPDDRWARIGRAEALRKLSRFDEAEADLAPLPDSDPVARASRVRIALERGDDQAADALLAGGPADDVDLALLRGRFALARANGPEAVRQFRIAYDQAHNLREAVLGLGQALKTTGDLAAATPLLEEARKHERLGSLVQRAAAKNRDDTLLMRELGEACAALGRNLEARAWYNLAITEDPLDTQAQQGLARIKEKEAEEQAKAKDKPPAS